jgi:hypothetical protein
MLIKLVRINLGSCEYKASVHTVLFVPCVYQIIVCKLYYIIYRYIPTCFGGANHHHQGRQRHRQKTLLLDCGHLVRHTFLYFASLFSPELFMSYFPMCDIALC